MNTFEETLANILKGIEMTARSPFTGFPHYADGNTSQWVFSPDGDWTGGFWNGMLWLAASYTNEKIYTDWVHKRMKYLKKRAISKTIFRGFLFYYGAALGSILLEDGRAKEIAVEGARELAKDYIPDAGIIPLGEDAEEAESVGVEDTNIDGVSIAPLLFWAANETGDKTLTSIANNHVSNHIELCIRNDHSVAQSASFDPETGKLLRRYTHKGYSNESTWTRAQAWAMINFTLAYQWNREETLFKEAAIKTSDWWVDHLPEDGIAFWDFDAPNIPNVFRDTSATAIATCALLKLAHLIEDQDKKKKYLDIGNKSLNKMIEGYVTPMNKEDKRRPGMLLEGCYNTRMNLATKNELIWGDYYLFESLLITNGYLDPNIV